MAKTIDTLRPDAKGRVTLGALAEGVSSFHVTINEDGSILLEPYSEVPLKEKWIFEDKSVYRKIRKGLIESSKGEIKSLGDFKQFSDDGL